MVSGDVRLRIDRHNYYYRVMENPTADRYPIVFVGGAFQDMSSWANWVRFFAPRATVILVDLPGGGKADLLPHTYGVDFLAEALHRVLVSVGVAKAEVMSVSYGSLTAYCFARSHPEMVSRLYLSGIMSRMPWEVRDGIAHTLGTLERGDMVGFAREVVDGLLYHDHPVTVAREKMIRRILHTGLCKMNDEAKRKYVENTRRILTQGELDIGASPDVPALVFTGENDGFTRPEFGREVAASFKRAVFTTIRNADHLCGAERFEVAAELARRFMEGLSLDDLEGCNACEYFGDWIPTQDEPVPLAVG